MDYLAVNWIAILALIVSFSSLYISIKVYRKASVKLKISYDIEKSYCFGFNWYEKYELLICYLTIENLSTSNVSITKIKLLDNHLSSNATKLDIHDYYNDNGISLINFEGDDNLYIPININSENILKYTRIPSLGTVHGYAVFEGIHPIRESKDFKIIVDTPDGSFNTKVTINPLPKDFKPINPLNEN